MWETELLCRELVEESAPFGAVREAVLGITAPYVRVRLAYRPERTEHPIVMACADDGTVVEESDIYVTLWTDHTAEKGHDRALVDTAAVLVAAYYRVQPWDLETGRGRVWAVGLVLVEVPGENGNGRKRFERHGMFDINVEEDAQRVVQYKNWIDSFERGVIEIQ